MNRLGFALISAAALALHAGCASTPKPTPEPTPESPRPRDLAGARLEASILTILTNSPTLAATLHDLETAGAADDPLARDRWRRAGLRAITIPTAQAQSLINSASESLGPVAAQESATLIPSGNWAPVTTSPPRGPTRATLHNGPVTLAPGRAQLIARAWPTPGPLSAAGLEPRMVIELAPRFTPTLDPTLESIANAAGNPERTPRPAWLIDSLRYAVELRDGESLLIVHEDPAADWPTLALRADDPITIGLPNPDTRTRAEAPATISPTGDILFNMPTAQPSEPPVGPDQASSDSDTPVAIDTVARGQGQTIGPTPPTAPTLGETILLIQTNADGVMRSRFGEARRRVIILTPALPERFTLTPTVAAN